MKRRALVQRQVFLLCLAATVHAGVLGLLALVKTGRGPTPQWTIQISPISASQVKYQETKVLLGENPTPATLPTLLPPPFIPPPRYIVMSEALDDSAALPVRPSASPVQFMAMARPKPPGFAAVAGPEKGLLKGHEGLARHLQQVTRSGLDVVFVFDTTESMAGVLKEVKEKIKLMMRIMAEVVPGFRVGMVAYRDYAAAYLTKPLPLTSDLQEVYRFIEEINVGMGYKSVDQVGQEDIEWSEAVLAGLNAAINFRWRPSARKIVVLIGDAPPHPEELDQTLALVRSFWKSGQGIVHTIFIPAETHARRPAANPLDPKMKGLFTEEELKFLIERDQKKRPAPADASARRMEEVFRNIALNGGGECVLLNDEREIVREMLSFALGQQWRGDINEIYDVLRDKP